MVTVSIPYTNGESDFSSIFGERFFEMRKIEYRFMAVVPSYANRKTIENTVKRELMMPDFSKLYDTHDKDGYWYAKCESVNVDDIHDKNEIAVSVSFIARPFFIVDSDEKQDLWNDMWYPDKYEQKLSFNVEYKKSIHIWNGYDKSISPIITFDGVKGSIKYLDQIFPLEKGRNEFFDFQLLKGVNDLVLIGDGSFSFRLLGEVMM
ncbi:MULTISPECIES: hypothetical protein [Lactococcus]|uniref:hypothetical protein n=1 Tax=Lactococcus TaxID=1357 RepID=UPI001BCACDE3|nr:MULTISPECIES: hypothetical protein [Lactococcus]MBS4463512.1 hypothetical protein [Lactococcus garvieae]